LRWFGIQGSAKTWVLPGRNHAAKVTVFPSSDAGLVRNNSDENPSEVASQVVSNQDLESRYSEVAMAMS
jgi:hypothetical protein